MSDPASSDYRLSGSLAARLTGSLLVVLAVVLFVLTALVVWLHLPADLLVLLAGLGVLAVVATGYVVTRRAHVVHLDEVGYRVRLIRGTGVREARWKDVSEATASTRHGMDCLVLELTDGRSTVIPVAAVAGDRDELARDVREHLQRGQGLRPLP